MELRAGVRLDRYTLVTCLGEGGQASVWKAIDPLDGGAVRALKVFQLRGKSEQHSERARREAKASAGARHAGLLPCRGLFEDPEQDLLFLVFDYERGRSLADAMHDPRMTPEHRRSAVRQLADTLAYVHARSIIHRDVKPDNVLVTDAFWGSPAALGTLKLVDFGIAAPAGNPQPLTREGGVVGTAPYLPPELVETTGVFPAGGDYQRDVFAFGVLAWEVLIGGHPTGLPISASRDAFAGAYLMARAGKRAWPPGGPSSAELPIVQACLSLSSTERPESCIVVANAFQTGMLEGARARTSEPVVLERRSSRPATDVHVTPTTAPMDAPQHSWAPSYRSVSPEVPVVGGPGPAVFPAPPPPNARRPANAASGKKGSLGLILGVGLLAVVVTAVAMYFGMRQPVSEADQPLPVWTAPPPITPPRSPSVEAPAPAPAPTRAQVVCCSDATNACRSGRECQPSPCDAMLGNGPWRLRVSGGFLQSGKTSTDIQKTWRSSFICLKNTRTGDRECASSSLIWTKGSDARNRVLATTDDMITGKIEVQVVDGGSELIRAPGFAYPAGYKSTALCSNVTLHLGQWAEPNQGKISVFMDDP